MWYERTYGVDKHTADVQNHGAMQTTSPIGSFTVDFTPLRMRRRALGMPLRRIEAVTGIAFQSIWRFETNQREPNITQITALARALGVPMHELFAIREIRG